MRVNLMKAQQSQKLVAFKVPFLIETVINDDKVGSDEFVFVFSDFVLNVPSVV